MKFFVFLLIFTFSLDSFSRFLGFKRPTPTGLIEVGKTEAAREGVAGPKQGGFSFFSTKRTVNKLVEKHGGDLIRAGLEMVASKRTGVILEFLKQHPEVTDIQTSGDRLHNEMFVKAAQLGRRDVVSLLLDFNPELVHVASREDGRTALHIAVDKLDIRMAKRLLANRPTPFVDARDSRGETALYRAVRSGETKLIDLIVKKGKANAAVENGEYRESAALLALRTAVEEPSRTKYYLKIYRALRDVSPKVDRMISARGETTLQMLSALTIKRSVFQMRMTLGIRKDIKIAIKNGAEVIQENHSGMTAAALAAERGNLSVLKILGKHMDLTHIDSQNRTLLFFPAKPGSLQNLKGRLKTIKYLISKGVDPAVKDRYEDTALHGVFEIEVLNALAKGNKEELLQIKNERGETPIDNQRIIHQMVEKH